MTDEHQFCTFFLDRLFFGIKVDKIQEIIRYQDITKVPLAPSEIGGLINLRSQIVTAIDLRRRMNLSPLKEGRLPINIVVKVKEETISLLVDDVGDVLDIPGDCFETPPETLKGKVRELIQGVYKLENQLLMILDSEKVVDVRSSVVQA